MSFASIITGLYNPIANRSSVLGETSLPYVDFSKLEVSDTHKDALNSAVTQYPKTIGRDTIVNMAGQASWAQLSAKKQAEYNKHLKAMIAARVRMAQQESNMKLGIAQQMNALQQVYANHAIGLEEQSMQTAITQAQNNSLLQIVENNAKSYFHRT